MCVKFGRCMMKHIGKTSGDDNPTELDNLESCLRLVRLLHRLNLKQYLALERNYYLSDSVFDRWFGLRWFSILSVSNEN